MASSGKMQGALACPGKVFVLGEYACLVGRPAILLPCEPSFSLHFEYPVDRAAANALDAFHPLSPAGLLLRARPETASRLRLSWRDPHATPIGVGSSSAQFILVFRALEKIAHAASPSAPFSPAGAETLVREYWGAVGASQALRPSGVDVALQAIGRPSLIANEPFSAVELPTAPLRDGAAFFFLAYCGHKAKTHDHLKELAGRGFPRRFAAGLDALGKITARAAAEWSAGQLVQLGRSLNEYQEALGEMEIAPREFSSALGELRKIPGVLGCKGAGAQGGDCALLLAERAKRQAIEAALAAHGFTAAAVSFPAS